jgi:iron(III) transport system substrate-binding protein
VKANNPRVFPNNVSIVEAVSAGEIDAGFVNHYYAEHLHAQGQALKAQNKYYEGHDPGALVNVAGVAVLKSSGKLPDARRFVEFLLAPASQQYFAEKTYEVPTVEGVGATVKLPNIAEFKSPDVDLGKLGDVKGTTDMLTRLGIL